MHRRWWAWIALMAISLLVVGLAPADAAQPDAQALVQISAPQGADLGLVELAGVPVYARLTGDKGSYLLAGATFREREMLQAQGVAVRVLDPDVRGASYYLAYLRPGHLQPDWAAYGQLLLDDQTQVLLRTTPRQAERLAELGLEIATLPMEPIRLAPALEGGISDGIRPIAEVEAMIDQVDQDTLYQYEEWLTGVEAASIGGQPYTIVTRNTNSGTPIQKATQFVYEHLASLGLQAEYNQWSGATYPNVIATQPGQTDPDNIYVICAHLDDMPSGATAPGADDNASGSIGVLMAADILSQYDFGCTLKYALWTGEEQGLLGSGAWAAWASSQGLNIRGVLNLDMISYNSDAYPILDLHARSWLPDSVAMANLFSDVVGIYDLNLTPDVFIDYSLGNYSDNKSFWDQGYAAILAIEDDDDFTPYYHTTSDRLPTLNMPYFAEFVKASIGTFVHMSGCLLPPPPGHLEGHVTAAGSGAPIADATITMNAQDGSIFQTIANSSGYYSQTLTAGTYTVTAEAYAYLPAVAPGVVVTSEGITVQDLVLEVAPTHTVSGTVTEAGTGLPLLAEIEFEGAPGTVWTDPDTGFYQASLVEGDYTQRVRAAKHQAEERSIVVDHDQTQDFALQAVPCTLLVDDDVGDNYENWYEGALTAAGQDYHVWRVATAGSPTGDDLALYGRVIWFTGDDSISTLTAGDQSALAAYLDGGGRLFVSGQNIGYDIGTSLFYANYLHAYYDSDDTNNYSLTGLDYLAGSSLTIQGGDGALNQTRPSDVLPRDGAAAVLDYPSPHLYGGVAYQDGTYRVVYFSFGFEAIDNQADRTGVMVRTLSWLGGCECDAAHETGFSWKPLDPTVGDTVAFTGTAQGAPLILFDWDFGDGGQGAGPGVTHAFSAEGSYTVTLTATNACGTKAISDTLTVLPAVCEPVQILTATEEISGCQVTFGANLAGTPSFAFAWDLGVFSSTEPTPTVTFDSAGTYPFALTVLNCGGLYSDTLTDTVTVTCEGPRWYVYLPVIVRRD